MVPFLWMQPGLVEGDKSEESKKQKTIKALLNKITPQNFDKILDGIIDVGYDREETLLGLVNQVVSPSLQPSFLLSGLLLLRPKCTRVLAQSRNRPQFACFTHCQA